jgi:uncharacterized protein (TIGR03083 family)
MTEEVEIYEDARARFVDLIRSIPEPVLEEIVPACPLWTCRRLVAHLVGASEDFVNRNFPTGDMSFEDWTAAQAARRPDWSIGSLISAWDDLLPSVLAGLRSELIPATALINDTAVHEQDVRGLAQLPGGVDGPGYEYARKVFVVRLGDRLDAAGFPSLMLEADDWTVYAGTVSSSESLRAPAFDMTRAISGRRSIDQMRSFTWSCDPEPCLPLMPAFRLPDRDVEELSPAR